MPPPTPRTPRKSSGSGTGNSTPGIEGPAPALRNFHLSFATHSRKPSNTSASFTTRSPSPSRSSIFRRPATIDTQSSYTQTSNLAPSLYSPKPTRTISPEFGGLSPDNGSSTWRLRRPTVLGHFLAPSDGQADDANPPRPSTSSTFTHSSATFTQPSTDTLSTPPKMSWGRSSSPGSFFRPAHSLWSLPTSASHLNDPPNSTKMIARDYDSDRSSTFRPTGARPATTLSLLGSPRRRKKRKLIISGLTHGDHSRFEGVRKWCEVRLQGIILHAFGYSKFLFQSFGEVNQITRMQNGDLHIDFRKNEVADTVSIFCALDFYLQCLLSTGVSPQCSCSYCWCWQRRPVLVHRKETVIPFHFLSREYTTRVLIHLSHSLSSVAERAACI